MKKRQIVNIVNFIRACEPREQVDLILPVREQLKLLRRYGLPGTFLLQYDALLEPAFIELLKDAGPELELGVWLEIVQPMAEAAGIRWRGRFPWDWHAHCGFSVGYTLTEREQLVDLLFEKFHEAFGYYPRSMGSWTIDAHSLAYASDRYGLDASCNCKDQWGTDGYTMWGGYSSQAYYPSRGNMFAPAGSPELQIDTPVFRMLGSDPIYQYDFGLDVNSAADECQGVVTLEPVYCGGTGGGGVPAWVDWYLRENFSGRCLAFGYTQAGQENSLGWDRMKNGLTDQLEKIAALRDAGKLEVETLGDSGRWFRHTFRETPAASVAALSDWTGGSRKSVWYNCKNYRVNLYCEDGHFWLRDLYLFRDGYRERYLTEVCRDDFLLYDNLPVMDGNRFSGHGVRAGVYPFSRGLPLSYSSLDYVEDGDAVLVSFETDGCGRVVFRFDPERITVCAEGSLELRPVVDPVSPQLPAVYASGEELRFTHRGFPYSIVVQRGLLSFPSVFSEDGSIVIGTV